MWHENGKSEVEKRGREKSFNKKVEYDDAPSSKYEIDAKCFHKNEMSGASKVSLLRLTPDDGVHDESVLLDANLQRLIARLHQINFFESFLVTSQNVLRDIRETLGVGVSAGDGRHDSARLERSCQKKLAKNVFLVTTECRFRCNIYLVNPRPLDKADESAFEVKSKKSSWTGKKSDCARNPHAIMQCKGFNFMGDPVVDVNCCSGNGEYGEY